MGRVQEDVLRLLAIPFAVASPSTIADDVDQLTRTMRATQKPVALVVGKGLLQA